LLCQKFKHVSIVLLKLVLCFNTLLKYRFVDIKTLYVKCLSFFHIKTYSYIYLNRYMWAHRNWYGYYMDFIGIDYFMPIAISALISSRNSYICPECDNPCYIYSPSWCMGSPWRHFGSLAFTFKLYGFRIFWHGAYQLTKVISETRHLH
jgi:hypothetical protein